MASSAFSTRDHRDLVLRNLYKHPRLIHVNMCHPRDEINCNMEECRYLHVDPWNAEAIAQELMNEEMRISKGLPCLTVEWFCPLESMRHAFLRN